MWNLQILSCYLISVDFLASEYCYDVELLRALQRHDNREAVVAPIILRSCDWSHSPFRILNVLPTDGRAIASWASRDEAFEEVAKRLRSVIQQMMDATNSQKVTTARRKAKKLMISKIELNNTKCFENTVFDFAQQDQVNYWVTILGDNAIGKSTLLKSIALGLCRESDAAALMRLSEVYGDFIKSGERDGYIKIFLCENDAPEKSENYVITTKITEARGRIKAEDIEQETEPVEDFPWDDIFVCGYGTY
jgi:AAA domain